MRFLAAPLLAATLATPAFGVIWNCGLIDVDTEAEVATFYRAPLPMRNAVAYELPTGEPVFSANVDGPPAWADSRYTSRARLTIGYDFVNYRFEANIRRFDTWTGVFEYGAYLNFVCYPPL